MSKRRKNRNKNKEVSPAKKGSLFPSIAWDDTVDDRIIAISIVAILVLGSLLRFIFLFTETVSNPLHRMTSQSDVFDQYNFISLAQDILGNHMLGAKIIFQSPGYSYVIAVLYKVFGENFYCIFAFQILLGVLAIYVMFRATSLLFENKKVGLVAAFITALYAPFIFYECTILRASIITYVYIFAFYFFLKAVKQDKMKYVFFGGIMIGLSVVLRPNLLPPFLILYIILLMKGSWKSRVVYVVLFCVGLAVFIAPMALRNRALKSDAIISSSHSELFWSANFLGSRGLGTIPGGSPLQTQLGKEAEGKVFKTLYVFAREIIKYPAGYADLYRRKIRFFLSGYEIPTNYSYDLFKENSVILKSAFLDFNIIVPFAILGFFLLLRTYKQTGLLYVFFFAICIFVLLLAVQSRYRLTAVPFFIMFAAYTIYWMFSMWRTKQYAPFAYAAIALVVVALYTKPNDEMISRWFGARIRNIDYGNLANAYLYELNNERENITPERKEMLLRAAAKNRKKSLFRTDPERKMNILMGLGLIYLDLKDYKQALDTFYQVLDGSPEHKDAKAYVRHIEKILETSIPAPPGSAN